MLCICAAGAFDAAGERWVEVEPPLVDLFAANHAVSILTFRDAPQCRFNTCQLLLSLATCGKRRSLLLNRVHA